MARKKKPHDLLGPFDDLVKQIKKQRALGLAIDVTVSASLLLDSQAADETAFSVGSLLVERIKDEADSSAFGVQHETRERRRRARDEDPRRSRTGGAVKAARYPAGYIPDPQGSYGVDSGYLLEKLILNVDKGKKDVFAGIPRNRGKAAFVLRRSSPIAAGGIALQRAVKSTTELRLKKIITRALKRHLKGTGIKATLQ